MTDKDGKITGKIILHATVSNTSNLLVGSGKGEVQDMEVIRENGEIFIPASGFAGVLNKHFKKWVKQNDTDLADIKKQARYLWGSEDGEDNNPTQSHIIIDDLKYTNIIGPKVVVRDGVKIDPKTGIGANGSKYDYELIEPGAQFLLNAEITLRKGFDVPTFLKFVKFIADEGKKGKYKHGAFTSHGFGELKWDDIKVCHFKFHDDATKWFDYLISGQITGSTTDLPAEHGLKLNTIDSVTITGRFTIKNSLIIGASDKKSLQGNLDKTHIKNSSDHPLLTSKSIRGPIRHRALKILKTLGNTDAETIVNDLFGMVDETLDLKKKGKIIPKEYEFNDLHKIDADQIQPRIKIDRFTGGTINTALLSSQPIWHKDENITLEFEIERYDENEIGIMLLVLKDLMNEDLPIGGEKAIGRGVLKGTKLEVRKDDENYFELTVSDDGKISIDDKGEFILGNIEQCIKTLQPNV